MQSIPHGGTVHQEVHSQQDIPHGGDHKDHELTSDVRHQGRMTNSKYSHVRDLPR